MDRLLLINSSLPLLQDLISKYNMEHKLKMKNVLNELTDYKLYTLTCECCNIRKIGVTLYSVSALNFICSKKCLKKFVSLIPYGCPDKHYYDQICFNF